MLESLIMKQTIGGYGTLSTEHFLLIATTIPLKKNICILSARSGMKYW